MNPYEHDESPGDDPHPFAVCACCGYALDGDETAVILGGDRVSGWRMAHPDCTATCFTCERLHDTTTMTRVGRLLYCPTCAEQIPALVRHNETKG